MSELERALELSDDTIIEARAAVARNQPLKDYLNESGMGNNPEVIRRFAENPDIDPVVALGPVHGERYAAKRRNPLGPKRKTDMSPGQSFGSFLMGE